MLNRWETLQTTLFSLAGLVAVSESHQKLAKPVLRRRSCGKTQMKRILDFLQRRPSEESNLPEKLRARASLTLKV